MDYSLRGVFDRIYQHPKKILVVPLFMFILAVSILGYSYVNTGSVVQKGIDFTSGSEIHIPVEESVTADKVKGIFGPESSARTMTGGGNKWIVVTTTEVYEQDEVERLLEEAGVSYQSGGLSIRSLGPSVGDAFFLEAQLAALVAILIMSAVIFIAFRSIVPSLAVIFAALTDILVAMAGMSILGIDLSLGALAALLMLLGYSVDTDILLSTRVLKQKKEDLDDRIWDSVLTGSTMTFAAIAAFTALYVVSPAGTLDQISSVIIIGLFADLPITWLGNAFILKWYVESDL
ncbi:MAG: protein translocase subunit SecF [Candidatus Nanohaloarchaeota archaeon QJJ-7]|nr:protein translocase subunit SecF [Candidatus Nanohaloarchaeota archaeon QJJ-7]